MDKIPFDVEKWKSGKYDAVNGRGTAVKSLLIHDVACMFPISAVLENDDNETYMLNGQYDEEYPESSHNLFLIPKKRKVWIAVRKRKVGTDNYYITSQAYINKDDIPIQKESIGESWHIFELELPE